MHRSSLRYGSVFSSNAWLVNDWAAYNVHLKKQHAFNIFPNMRSIYVSLVQKTKLNNPDETLNQGPDSLWSLKIPGCPSKKDIRRWNLGILARIRPLTSDHHGLLIICWLPSSLLLFTNTLVCGGRSGVIWMRSHHAHWMLHIGGGWGDSSM